MADLPLEIFPERGDRNRLRALYAVHGQEAPDVDTRRFWIRSLTALCRHRRCLRLQTRELEQIFTVDGAVPLSLAGSLPLLSKEFVYRESFSRSFLFHAAVCSAFDAIKGYIPGASSQELVCLPLLQEMETLLLRRLDAAPGGCALFFLSPSSATPEAPTFIAYLRSLGTELKHPLLQDLSADDVDLFTEYLQSRGAMRVDVERRVVKAGRAAGPVKEAEVSKLKLRTTMTTLEALAWQYRERIEVLEEQLRGKLRRRVDKRALLHDLRTKKTLEAALARLQDTLLTLQPIEDSLMVAETNALVLEAYRAGALGLRSLRVQPEEMERAVEDWGDEADLLEEARAALTLEGTEEDEDELSLELEQLCLVEETRTAATVQLPVAPLSPVPSISRREEDSTVEAPDRGLSSAVTSEPTLA